MSRGKLKKAMGALTTLENPKESVKIEAPDISKFMFEKKPHIKIEYEKDSPKKDKEETKGLWEPANWRDFLINLRNMRSNNDAPVDSMGCHMTMDENALPKVMRYQSLIALMLSSQTKDQVTFAAMERLRKRGLTVYNVLSLSDEELGKLIYPVGFWKTKVKYIKKTTQTLKEQYDGDIPDSVDKLCKLTGVGPKMAHICMQVAWKKTTGIGVDTHVHRISNRIGWVKKPTTTPEDTRKALQSWLPFDLWSEVNHLMVGFGQTICQPVSPMCHECLNSDICPSSDKLRKKFPNKKSPLKQNVKDNIKQEIASPVKQEKTLLSPGKQKLTLNLPSELSNEVKDPIMCVKTEPLSPIRKRKITSKKDIEDTQDLPKLETESVHISPNKRRLSPKNTNKVADNMDNMKEACGLETNVKSIIKNRRNDTQKTETIITDNIEDTAGKLKKSPNKRKLNNEEIIESSPSDNETITRKIKPKKESTNSNCAKPKNIDPNTTHIKRKSPRIKN